MMKGAFLTVCLMLVITLTSPNVYAVNAHGNGVTFWCAPDGKHGLTATAWDRDNILAISEPYTNALLTLGYQPGGWMSAFTLAAYQGTTINTGTRYGPGPTYGVGSLGYAVIGPFIDDSYLVVPPGAGRTPIIAQYAIGSAYQSWQYIFNIANGTNGAWPSSYPNGAFATQDSAHTMQASLLAPNEDTGQNFLPPQNEPVTLAQNITALQVNLEQATPQPQAPTTFYPWTFAEYTTGPVGVRLNGQVGDIVLPQGTWLNFEVTVNTSGCAGYPADWWLAMVNELNGTVWWATPAGWVKSATPIQAVAPGSLTLQNRPWSSVWAGTELWGTWSMYFGVDMTQDNLISNPVMVARVRVTLY